MSPSSRPSFRLKLQLVSALALTIALQAMPASAMDKDDGQTPGKAQPTNINSNSSHSSLTDTSQVTPEFHDTLEQINYYYDNPEEFLDFLNSKVGPQYRIDRAERD